MASNVEGKFQYLIETKEQIKAAIQEKGQTISSSTPFRDYADKIRAISGGSSDVCYVTFKNGSTTLYKKAVAVGDDCVDVLAKGLLTTTPTKASTAQYHYTYSGWSRTNGGAASDTALSNVTANRTVYAAFTSSVRSYTITYYDSDGTTVLKTETLVYGATPNYVPSKSGFDFAGWTPALGTVTGTTSYTAKWAEKTGLIYKASVPKSVYGDATARSTAINNDGSLVAVAQDNVGAPNPIIVDISGDTATLRDTSAFGENVYVHSCDFAHSGSKVIFGGGVGGSGRAYEYTVSGPDISKTLTVSSGVSPSPNVRSIDNDQFIYRTTASGEGRTSSNVTIKFSGALSMGAAGFYKTPNSNTLLAYSSYSSGAGAALFDLSSGAVVNKVFTDMIDGVSYNTGGNLLAVTYPSNAGHSRWVSVYDTTTWTEICNLEGIVTSKSHAVFLGMDTLIVGNGANVYVYTVTANGLAEFEYEKPTYSGGTITEIRANYSGTHVVFRSSSGLEIWQKCGA